MPTPQALIILNNGVKSANVRIRRAAIDLGKNSKPLTMDIAASEILIRNEKINYRAAFEAHRREQVLSWAKETTALQRLQWLQSALEFACASGINLVEQKEQLAALTKNKSGRTT